VAEGSEAHSGLWVQAKVEAETENRPVQPVQITGWWAHSWKVDMDEFNDNKFMDQEGRLGQQGEVGFEVDSPAWEK
jgi:hypothetical protein